MTANPYILVAVSVIMHVAWNLMARRVDARANFIWWGLLAHLLLLGPYALWNLYHYANWNLSLVLALTVSALANSVYFVGLRRAYRFAPVSLVYPLARSSPILIVVWAWLLFSEPVNAVDLGAICLSVLGLWILAWSARDGLAAKALPWAGLAALCTSIYSISDKFAVVYLPSFATQLGFITVGYLVSFLLLSVIQYRDIGRFIPEHKPKLVFVLLGGLFIGTAYALVVRAMQTLPASHVVSFTNAGIVLAIILSFVLFKELENWRSRLFGSIVVTLGLAVLALSN